MESYFFLLFDVSTAGRAHEKCEDKKSKEKPLCNIILVRWFGQVLILRCFLGKPRSSIFLEETALLGKVWHSCFLAVVLAWWSREAVLITETDCSARKWHLPDSAESSPMCAEITGSACNFMGEYFFYLSGWTKFSSCRRNMTDFICLTAKSNGNFCMKWPETKVHMSRYSSDVPYGGLDKGFAGC